MGEIVELVEEWHCQFFERDRLNFRGGHVHKYLNYLPGTLFPDIVGNFFRNEASVGMQVR